MVLEVNNKPAPIKAENATFTDHTKKETKANLIPRALPPRIKMDNASLVPRFPSENNFGVFSCSSDDGFYLMGS
jgi:hypothetical protein